MKKLIIDARNGIAGDITCAGLIGLGASQDKIIKAMEYAGNQIGKTIITPNYDNNVASLDIKIDIDKDHLHESKARELLDHIIKEMNIQGNYKEIAQNTLDVLCKAERYVHSHDERLAHMMHSHHHHNEQGHHHCHDHHDHAHHHDHSSHHHEMEATLHEAKDILIDVTGFAVGLQELKIDKIYYHDYVNVGNGIIEFSHGRFEVPAPATEHILKTDSIKWQHSDKYNTEMTTPTGASIIAGCKAERIKDLDYLCQKESLARGTKDLPPISFYLIDQDLS